MRLLYISILGVAAVSASSAGTIEIGGQSAGPITSPTNAFGLTAAYIGAGNSTWTERNFQANLFTNDTISNSTLGGSTLPDAVPTAPGSQQFVDPNNGVVFAMINDGSTGANLNQYWGSPNTAGSPIVSSITIPIGLSGLTGASILLNDWFGLNGVANNDTITFNFTGDGGQRSVNLSNGNQIADATACIAASPSWVTTPTNCTQFARSVSNAGGGSPFIPTTTDVAWSASYSNANANGATIYSGTSGNLSLYDINFDLSAFAVDTLTSITIADNNNLANSSRLVLSAITVEQAPEPSTVLLFIAGLGVIGFIGQRRKAKL